MDVLFVVLGAVFGVLTLTEFSGLGQLLGLAATVGCFRAAWLIAGMPHRQ